MERSVWHVLAQPVLARVIDSDDNHRRHRALADQPVRRFVYLPLDSSERSARLEQILPVIQIKHRIVTPSILRSVIPRRQPHAQETRVPKDAAAKLMQPQI